MPKRRVGRHIVKFDYRKLKITSVSLCSGGMQHNVEKISTKATTLLETSSPSEICTQSYGPAKSRESQLWEFRDLHLGVLGQNVIWVLVLWPGTEYTIRGKVVASLNFGPW